MVTLLLMAGLLLFLVGGLLLLVAAFRAGVLWGLGCIIFPVVQFFFVIVHWKDAWRPMLVQLVGILLVVLAAILGGETHFSLYREQFNQILQQYAPEQLEMLQQADESGGPAASLPDISDPPEEDAMAPEGASQGQRTVYKCKDDRGRVSYIDKPCTGEQVKTISISSAVEEKSSGPLDAFKRLSGNTTVPARCDGRTRCSEMTSCEEARFFQAHCPGAQMDGNDDGVPCESQWCNSL